MKFCAMCGKQVDSINNIEKKTSNPTATKKKNSGRSAWLLIVSVLAVISIGFNITQFFMHQRNEEQLKEEVASLNKKVFSQTYTISSQAIEIANLGETCDLYDKIVKGMRGGNAGYASKNFFASDSVIVVSRNDKNCKFTLTANWPGGGSVDVSYSSLAASVSFDNNEWDTSTQMTVHPRMKGVTVVTFSNNVDSKTFKVLIIVTD